MRSGKEAQRRERKMPIRCYLEEGVFTPKTISEMSKALEATVEILGIGRDEAKRRGVAKLIIRVAKEDDSLDAVALRDRAVAALGGAAYSDIPANPQPSPLLGLPSNAGGPRGRLLYRAHGSYLDLASRV
jgi:hypothetical protein